MSEANFLGSDNQYASKKDMGPRWDYSPTHDDVAHCCPPNLIRITPYHINRMWMLSTDKDKGLVSAFYGPCKLKVTLNDTEVTINQITKYPFEDEILFKIYVSSEIEFPITLRAPEWSEGTTVFINNKYYKTVQKGFFTIKRKWMGENEIRIKFSPVIQLVNAVDGSIAVFRGPLLYSLKIPEKQIITREYNLEGFYDRDYVPEDDAFWDYTLRVKHMGIQRSDFKFEHDNNYSGEYLWEKSPIKIIARAYDRNGETKDIELVPIGCTILRRTSFPYYKKYD